jgi:hypothetical protein
VIRHQSIHQKRPIVDAAPPTQLIAYCNGAAEENSLEDQSDADDPLQLSDYDPVGARLRKIRGCEV